MFGLIYLRCPFQMLKCLDHLLNDECVFYYMLPLIFSTIFQTLFIGVWQFNLETKLRQEVRWICFNVLRAFALKMRKLSKLSDLGCFTNCRSAFFRFLMAPLQSSLNHCLPGCFGYVVVFRMVSSAIDITSVLTLKIGSVGFRIIYV